VATPTPLEPPVERHRGSNLRLVDVESPVPDDTQFIARMLRRSLTADQVAELVRILQKPAE
jgi:hypothetical protein